MTPDVRDQAEDPPARAGRQRRRGAGEDQWTAIEALVVDQAPGPRGAAHRLGQVGGLLRRHPLLRRGAGPTVIVSPLLALMRNQIAAAERAGIRAVTINSTNLEEWEDDPRGDRGRRGRRAAGEPGAAQQPRFPRRGAAPAGRDLRAARGRRGALHLRLGPRLPSRLPADPDPARRAARRHPGARDHRDRQRAGDQRRRRAAGQRRRWCCAARSTASRCSSACVRLQDRRATPGLAGRPPRRAARLRHRLHPHRRRDPGGRRLPARPRACRRRLLRPDRGHRTARRRGGSPRGRVKALVATQRAGHGLRQPTSASWSMSVPRRPRSPTTSRSAAPAAAADGPGGPAARRSRTATSGRTSPRVGVPARGWCGRPWPRWRRAAVSHAGLETQVELGRTRLETMLKVLDVDGAVRRVRVAGRRPGATGPTTPSDTRGWPRPVRPSSRRCWTTSTPTAAGCVTCASSSTIRGQPTVDAATTARPHPRPAPRDAAVARLAAGWPDRA